jgi:hypothetical protein
VSPSSDDGPLRGKVTLAAGEQRTGVKLVLSRRIASIRGVVVGPDQQPLAGVVVLAARDDDQGALLFGHGDGRAVTGGDGAFVLEGLPPVPLTLLATHPQHPPLVQAGVPAGTRDLRLRLSRAAVLEGTTVTAQGAPVTSYQLSVARPAREGEEPRVTAMLADQREPLQVEDRAGAFRVDRLAPGSYEVVAFTHDGRMAHLGGVVVAEGEHRRGLRLVADGNLSMPGGLKATGLRATMFRVSKP